VGTRRAQRGVPLVDCEKLVVGYDGQALLAPIDLSVKAGEFWAVIGRNGSGKTTWFKTLLGLLPPVEGHVTWHQPDLRLAYIPQRGEFDPLFPATTCDVVRMGTEHQNSFLLPIHPRSARKAAREAMEETEVLPLCDRLFRDLSEGQKQRVLLARAVAGRPDLALFDEPTASMDVRNEEETLALIDDLRKRHGMTVVIVSHFLGVAARYAEKVLFVDNETREVRVGPPDEILAHVDFATAAATAQQGKAEEARA